MGIGSQDMTLIERFVAISVNLNPNRKILIFRQENMPYSIDQIRYKFQTSYDVVEKIGSGGMGEVFLVRNRKLGGRVEALKVLHERFSDENLIVKQFKYEPAKIARMNHRNVITVYKFDEIDGIPFFTMEYLEGVSLRIWLKNQGKLAEKSAITIATAVCDALSEIHKQGIVHRDIKPGNIMCCEDGRIVVLDFGIARDLNGTRMTLHLKDNSGTAEYMSPEQVLEGNRNIDGRSDIYSLGITLFEMVTGRVLLIAIPTSLIGWGLSS
jgi:eukaryotic-like serine/threonine-protein kinase